MDWRIKIHRKIDDRWRRKKPNTLSVFLYLLTHANLQENTYQWHIIKRWDCIVWRKTLSENLWLSERETRTSINHLKTTSEVSIKTTNKFSIITVVWFEKYQWDEIKTTNKTTNKTPTTDQQPTTLKEYIRNKEEVREILGEDINLYINELYWIWKMIEYWYTIPKDKKSLLMVIARYKEMAKDYVGRKEDWTLDRATAKLYINQRYDYVMGLKKKQENIKNWVRNSFSVYSWKRWKQQ